VSPYWKQLLGWHIWVTLQCLMFWESSQKTTGRLRVDYRPITSRLPADSNQPRGPSYKITHVVLMLRISTAVKADFRPTAG
jgi:hypothetical protein